VIADARPDLHACVIQCDRLVERGHDAFGDEGCVVVVVNVWAEDGELVAGQPGDRVDGADGAGQSPADFGEQPVAGFVPEPVVDLFEAVQVQITHGEGAGMPVQLVEGKPQVVEEQIPVRQAGQRVVQCPERQLGFSLPAGGDVFEVAEDDGRSRPGDHRVGGAHPARLAVGPQVSTLHIADLIAGEQLRPEGFVAGPVVGVDQLDLCQLAQLRLGVAEHRAQRGVRRGDAAGAGVHVGDQDADRGVLERAAELLFAVP